MPIKHPEQTQPGETTPAFKAFTHYLNEGDKRSVAKTAKGLGKSKTLLDRWSSRNGWVARVRQIESERAAVSEKSTRDVIRDTAKQQAREARLHATAASVVSQALVRRVQTDPAALDGLPVEHLAKLSASATRAYKSAVLVERLALGMTTSQAGEQIPLEQAKDDAARLDDVELDKALAGLDSLVDEVAAARVRKQRKAVSPGKAAQTQETVI